MINGDNLNGLMWGYVGDTQQFHFQTADYVTSLDGHSPTTVASITPEGYLTLLEPGQCYVYLQGTFHLQWTLTVYPAPPPPVIGDGGDDDYIGLPFTEKVFSAVLSKSSIIAGRFAVGTQWGGDIDNINIDDVVNALPQKQKYPCAILYPATVTGNLQNAHPSDYAVRMFYMLFLAGGKVTGQNAISKPAQNLQSQHTIPETWHDMERCAIGFLRALETAIMNQPGYANTLHISSTVAPEIQTVTNLGNDKVSGVCLKFAVRQTMKCGYGDYVDTLTSIVLPDITDPHPLHKDM